MEAAAGKTTKEVASLLGMRPARVSKWHTQFARDRIEGLFNAPRLGKPATYDLTTERRIVAKLDEPPPEGSRMWNGPLVAEALGDVSAHQVWRVLHKNGIHLQRRRSCCVSSDPHLVAAHRRVPRVAWFETVRATCQR